MGHFHIICKEKIDKCSSVPDVFPLITGNGVYCMFNIEYFILNALSHLASAWETSCNDIFAFSATHNCCWFIVQVFYLVLSSSLIKVCIPSHFHNESLKVQILQQTWYFKKNFIRCLHRRTCTYMCRWPIYGMYYLNFLSVLCLTAQSLIKAPENTVGLNYWLLNKTFAGCIFMVVKTCFPFCFVLLAVLCSWF